MNKQNSQQLFKLTCAARMVVLLLVCFGLASSAPAAITQFWAGPGGTTNSPVSGTWTNGVGTGTFWSDGAIDTGNSTWTNGNSAVFAGADGTYGIKVGGAVTIGSINFQASGYTLTNNAAQTVTDTGGGTVAAGKTATIGSNVTIAHSGANATVINGAGTLSVGAGGTLSTPNSASASLQIGNTVGDAPTLSVDGGTVSILRSSGSIWMPNGVSGGTSGNISGTLTINSGAVTEVGGFVSLGTASGNTGTLNLNGGTLTTAALTGGGGVGVAGAGTGIVNFNGGTLKAQQAGASFATNLTTANVRNGGAVINNNAFAITIGQALLHSAIGGDNATDGGLTSSGSSTLTLLGANTYNGPTIVSNGTVVTTTASIGGGTYTVKDGAALEVQVNAFGSSLTNSSLTLGSSGNLTNNFTLNGNASDTIPAVVVNGALNLNGTVKVNVSGSLTGPSTNILMSYGSISGSGSFVAGTLPSVPGYVGLLVNDTTSKKLKLVYLPPSVPVQWAVTSGDWDTTTLNWQPLGAGNPTNYYELSPVTFDDNAAFASTHTVTLTGNRTPTDVNVNSTNSYVLTGSFAITAGGTLTKSGNGTLILGVNSAHSGGTIINAGTVQVGNGGTAGSLGSGGVTDNGALVFNRSDALPMANVISGSGSLTKNGNGTLSLTATNSYNGASVVNAGKLSVLSASSGSGDYTVADGATLEVQSVSAASYLQASSLTLGTSGQLTNNFVLGTGRNAVIPLVYSTGDVNLNGTVVVNVSGSGMSAGTYILVQYTGSLTGSGSFVPGNLPGISTLINDTANQQLKLVITTAGLVWDSGNTNNGGTIDPASGTWDLAADNLVWNNPGANVAYANGNNAIFAGADGAYGIKVGASVTPPILTFVNSGYVLTNDTPQTITLGSASTAIPKLVVAAGKTATIGTNVTVNSSSTSFFGNAGDTAGGTIIIENGGVFQETSGNSWVMDGAGTVLSVKTGGIVRHAGGGGGQVAIGAGNTGNPATLNVDGGSVQVNANNVAINIASGVAGVAGTLTLNSGSVNMPAGSITNLNVGAQTGNIGTLNLNGGTLSVPQVRKGSGAISTNNFNGGTLKAVNATFGSTFMTGLDRANVRNGGAVVDSGGFAITIGQALEHSDIAEDNATDGGLTAAGAGVLTLTGANTYTGTTTVSNGTLRINGSILSNATVSASGTLGGNGTINGAVGVNAGGTLAPGVGDTSTLTIAGNLNLQGNLAVVVNESVSPSNSFCIVNGTLSNTGTGTVTVANLGSTPAIGDSFKLFSQPVVNGSVLTITPAPGVGLAWTNKLAVDGSIAVVSAPTIPTYPTNITVAVSGNTLTLTWPATHLGWIAQSNSVSLIDTNYWFDIAGSDSVTSLTNTINPSLTNVFYRLRYP